MSGTSTQKEQERQKMKSLQVVIVGAGIGGLETAIALASDGHKVLVLESVTQFAQVRHTMAMNLLIINADMDGIRLVLGFVSPKIRHDSASDGVSILAL